MKQNKKWHLKTTWCNKETINHSIVIDTWYMSDTVLDAWEINGWKADPCSHGAYILVRGNRW